jgi:hypothetical protein
MTRLQAGPGNRGSRASIDLFEKNRLECKKISAVLLTLQFIDLIKSLIRNGGGPRPGAVGSLFSHKSLEFRAISQGSKPGVAAGGGHEVESF